VGRDDCAELDHVTIRFTGAVNDISALEKLEQRRKLD
jgi:hypothetical protein